jgi:hypothetical protein
MAILQDIQSKGQFPPGLLAQPLPLRFLAVAPHEGAELLAAVAEADDVLHVDLVGAVPLQLEVDLLHDLLGVVAAHPLRQQLGELLEAELATPLAVQHDFEVVDHALPQRGLDHAFEDVDELLEGGLGDEGGEQLPDGCLVGGDVHEAEHGLEAGHVLAAAVPAEGNQRLVVAEQLVTSEPADLVALFGDLLVQRHQLLLLLTAHPARTLRQARKTAALRLQGANFHQGIRVAFDAVLLVPVEMGRCLAVVPPFRPLCLHFSRDRLRSQLNTKIGLIFVFFILDSVLCLAWRPAVLGEYLAACLGGEEGMSVPTESGAVVDGEGGEVIGEFGLVEFDVGFDLVLVLDQQVRLAQLRPV